MEYRINAHNIQNYIAYLYFARYKTAADPALIDSWGNLPENEISTHLNILYRKWGLQDYEIKAYENAYIQIASQSNTDIAQNLPTENIVNRQAHTINKIQAQTNIQKNTQKAATGIKATKQHSKNTWKYLLTALALGAGLLLIIPHFLKEPPKSNETIITTTTIKESTPISAAPTPVKTLSEKEKKQTLQIEKLIKSENNRDLSAILQLLSPNIEKFKSIEYPRSEEIEQFYIDLWNQYTITNNDRPEVKKMDENVYSIKTTYTLQVNDSAKKSFQTSEQKITFNDANEIIKIERLK